MIPPHLVSWAFFLVPMVLFAKLPHHKAMVWSMVLGWLFVPDKMLFTPLVTLDKEAVVAVSVLLAGLAYDAGLFGRFRWRWFDVPIVLFSTVLPVVTSVSNQIGPWGGAYDGLAVALQMSSLWCLPYLLGRVYLTDPARMRDAAMIVVMGALVYTPFVLWEGRMSPNLNRMIYGFTNQEFGQTKRWGGYRPVVFLRHGLMTALWMAMATLVAFWLWWTRAALRVWGLPMLYVALGLGMLTLWCRSNGAVLLLLTGVAVLVSVRVFKTRWLLALLLVTPVVYVLARGLNVWDGQIAVSAAQRISGEAAGSLQFRLENETVLVEHGLERPWFGWGGHGRNRPDWVDARVVTDGLWVITLTRFGVVGLVLLLTSLLLPALVLMRIHPASWSYQVLAPTVVLALVLVLFMTDCLMNAMENPIYLVGAGGSVVLSTALPQRPKRTTTLTRMGRHRLRRRRP